MKKTIMIALALSFIVSQAQALPLTFNDGSGAVQIATFDPAPGNALAVGSVPIALSPASNSFTLLYQASMSAFLNPAGAGITTTNLNTGYEITVVAGAGETASRINFPSPNGSTASFAFNPSNPTNFFYMYLDTAKNANPLTGKGYTDGVLLMSGKVTGSTGGFQVPNTLATPVALDQFGANNYPTLRTVTGTGSTDAVMNIEIASLNTTYFTNLPLTTFILELAFNTSTVIPFKQQDPSAHFSSDGIANGNYAPVRDPSNINGAYTSGPFNDFQFQADSNIGVNVAVPEPSTMLLTGLGLIALAGIRRRTNKTS